MSQQEASDIPVYGTARINDAGAEVFAVTLHRFIAPFLHEHGLESILVVVGFEGTQVESMTFEVSQSGARPAARSVPFASIADGLRDGSQLVDIGTGTGTRHLAIAARPTGDMAERGDQFMGFALIDAKADLAPESPAWRDLANRTSEAIRAARFTGLRLFFDERDQLPIKHFLYGLLDRLPQWCGVDHSAALILTGELEAMALNSSDEAEFELVAERMYLSQSDETGKRRERLVGLVIEGHGADAGLIGAAFKRVQEENEIGLHIFVPGDGDTWHLFGEPEITSPRFATRVNRPTEGMTVLVPLLNTEEPRGTELLGFLSLNFSAPCPIDPVASELLQSLGSKLARYLQRSPLFSLSARQLLVLEEVRRAYNETIGTGGSAARLRRFITGVNRIIVERTGVPCFAIGYISGADEASSQIRFVAPQGFTRFGSISIPVRHDDENAVSETSVAALSVRLDRPLVLAGGRGGDRPLFNNAVYVNETTREVIDARRVDPASIESEGTWRALSEYYKPSRDDSYATLAFPVSIGLNSLGVIAVEVDRQTDWLWWTGFGSQIFYRLLANELAVAFKLMGVPKL